MVSGTADRTAGPGTVDRSLPPITEMAVVSLTCIVIGGIYLASYLPKSASLVPAVILLVISAVVMAVNVVTLSRMQDFAWDSFFLVGRWALLAYAITASMLEYVFVVDGTRGAQLLVLTLMLLVYAVDIPMLLAFSVARYQPATRS